MQLPYGLRVAPTAGDAIIIRMTTRPIPPAIAKIAPDGNISPRQMQRVMIDISLRKQKPGTGSSHEFMRRRTALNAWPDLREILKGIDWVLIGGVATRAYMPERMTKDMDVFDENDKMILDLTKPAPPTYFPPRCRVPPDVVAQVDLGTLSDYAGLEKILRNVAQEI